MYWCLPDGSCDFFFNQKTAYDMRISDWSSDVCSSDLLVAGHEQQHREQRDLDGAEAVGIVGVGACDEAADEVVTWLLAATLHDVGEVHEHLGQRLLGLDGVPVARQCADECVGPSLEVVAPLGGGCRAARR